jgi:hypothetical protein
VISTDGNDVEMETGQSVILSSGERFDILIKTDGDPRKNYYIRAETTEVYDRSNVRNRFSADSAMYVILHKVILILSDCVLM